MRFLRTTIPVLTLVTVTLVGAKFVVAKQHSAPHSVQSSPKSRSAAGSTKSASNRQDTVSRRRDSEVNGPVPRSKNRNIEIEEGDDEFSTLDNDVSKNGYEDGEEDGYPDDIVSSKRRGPPPSGTRRQSAPLGQKPAFVAKSNKPRPKIILEEEEDEFEDDDEFNRKQKLPNKRGNSVPNGRSGPPSSRGRQVRDDDEDDEMYDDDYSGPRGQQQPPNRQRGGPPPRSEFPQSRARQGSSGGRVVQYNRKPAGAGASLTKGLEFLISSLPDPTTVKEAALTGLTTVQQKTTSLSANLYREVKGLTSSELEQVMLKATSPDDNPVKGKHVERLVGVTYQISSRYDIYDAVLRKLWSKMAEKDWRTTIKALYILHRFSADGAPEHAPALKARLRELRRTHDPKRKDKYFNSKQLLAGDNRPEVAKFRAFMARYAHYVLLRAQCFSGMFEEISTIPKVDKKSQAPPKSITQTSLRNENLEAAAMLLKAGLGCQLKDGEECENTAIATERVASDLIGLATAVAIALNRALKSDDMEGMDLALVKKWCQFYSETLLPQSRAMVRKSSPKLDAYGLFLPSRMGTTVLPELLEKGLRMEEDTEPDSENEVAKADEIAADDSTESENTTIKNKSGSTQPDEEDAEGKGEEEEPVEEAEDEDEYEYEEEEYYEEDEL